MDMFRCNSFFFAFWTIDWFYQLWIFKHLFKTHICILVKKVLIVFNRKNLYLCLLYAWFFVPVMIYLQYAFLKRHQTLINENRKLWSSMKKGISEIYRQLLWMISKLTFYSAQKMNIKSSRSYLLKKSLMKTSFFVQC